MMKSSRLLLLLASLSLLTTCNPPSPNDINIIPQPSRAYVVPGSFTIEPDTRIITQTDNEDVMEVCAYFNAFIQRAAGYTLEIVDDEAVTSFSGDMVITTFNADTAWGEERYKLEISGGSSIVLQARTSKGLFYGIQTLLQMMPPEIMSDQLVEEIDLEVPAVHINDQPRFEWRGMHLDVGRHFFPKDFVKKYIDLMAMYKMNVFHWHLTEDQGWRIEIEKYPDLTPNEKKICAFLRLNMSTKDICAITYQSVRSIDMARFRLRKKIGLDSDENLVSFLSQF